MKQKLLMLGIFVFILAFCFPSVSFAQMGMGMGCQQEKGDFPDHGKKEDLSEKVFHQMHMAIVGKDELAITDEQLKQIKKLKVETKKDLIMKKAEIETTALDIKSLLSDDNLDVQQVSKLIDRKYDLKKEKEKLLVSAYAAFKKILTDQQKTDLSNLVKFKEQQQGQISCPAMKAMQGKQGMPGMHGMRDMQDHPMR